jgi:hypothetical protein
MMVTHILLLFQASFTLDKFRTQLIRRTHNGQVGITSSSRITSKFKLYGDHILLLFQASFTLDKCRT